MGYKKGDILKTAFDTYTIHEQRGAGGSGEVYEVRDSETLPSRLRFSIQGKRLRSG
jgi:hypothetical protein